MGKMSQRKERVVMKVITIQLALGWREHLINKLNKECNSWAD
jgi:hypothetical protein